MLSYLKKTNTVIVVVMANSKLESKLHCKKTENILHNYESLCHNGKLCVKAYHRVFKFNLKMPEDKAIDSIRKHGLLIDYSTIEDDTKSVWFTLINDYPLCEECLAIVEYALPLEEKKVIDSIKGYHVRFCEQIPKAWMIKLNLIKD